MRVSERFLRFPRSFREFWILVHIFGEFSETSNVFYRVSKSFRDMYRFSRDFERFFEDISTFVMIFRTLPRKVRKLQKVLEFF